MFNLKINDQQELTFNSASGLSLVTADKSSHIANSMPTDINRVRLEHDDGNITDSVRFSMEHTDNTKSRPITIPLKDLGTLDWTSIDGHKCLLNPGFPKAHEYLIYIIHAALQASEEVVIHHISRLGTHIVDGVPVFCTGDRLIWPSNLEPKPAVKWDSLPNLRLAVDPNCSEHEAWDGMIRITDLNPNVGRVVFSLNLVNVLRKAFVVAGISPRCIVFLYGPSGSKKTTYSAFMSQLYNRDKPLESPPRLNSSIPAAVKLLYEKSDCVAVIDDLFHAQDNSINKQQEKTLLEITRVVADGVEPARMRGQKVSKEPPRCGVLFTGEYYTGTGSDAARLLPLRMEKAIDNGRLTACQNEPLVLSTFYSYFIEWYISNFDDICGLLKDWMTGYRCSNSEIHPRLEETEFCLEAAYRLFQMYGLEKEFIPEETALDKPIDFHNQLRGIVKEQNAQVHKGEVKNPSSTDYVKVISSLYRDKGFKLASSAKNFKADEHDGIIHKDHLYLREDKLMIKIRTFEPTAEFAKVLGNLKLQQALKLGKDSVSIKLGGCSLRFYAIKLSKL